ncbi:hypothetical protein ABW20_dc0102130 [Dactylellina cionopaga]|nr:hypothetical protein ABW20_dc0102130 [Dactylellina cionopaga]
MAALQPTANGKLEEPTKPRRNDYSFTMAISLIFESEDNSADAEAKSFKDGCRELLQIHEKDIHMLKVPRGADARNFIRREVICRVLEAVVSTGGRTLLVFHYAGHGYLTSEDELEMMAAHMEKTKFYPWNIIDNMLLRPKGRMLDDLDIICLVDACYSGRDTRGFQASDRTVEIFAGFEEHLTPPADKAVPTFTKSVMAEIRREDKIEETPARTKRLWSEDTQAIVETTDEESDYTIAPIKKKISNPAFSTEFALEDTQPTHKLAFEDTGDSQLPNTLITDKDGHNTHNIHLDYSPEKLTNPNYGDDETQKDPDSYNERMKDNVTSIAEVSHNISLEYSMDSDRMLDSQSQHREPVYFDERRRFEDAAALLVKERGEGSDDDDEIIRPAIQNDSLPIGLTQMFEASSPQRPAANSSAIPTSPHLGFTSPAIARELFPNAPPSSGVANRYISVEESQAERDRRKKKITYLEGGDDDGFGPKPPELISRLRNNFRTKDSVEQFKEISVVRPKPEGRVPGRRGRPPKNRVVEPLLPPSVPESDQPSSPVRTEPIPVDDDDDDGGPETVVVEAESTSDEDEDEDEDELEVPGTIEPVVTEVKKTQSSQHHPDTLKSLNTHDPLTSSQLEAIADSQPETTAKTAAGLKLTKDVAEEVEAVAESPIPFINSNHSQWRTPNTIDPSSPGHASTQEPPSSPPPPRRSGRREALIAKDRIYSQNHDPTARESVEGTPRITRAGIQETSKTAHLLDTLKTPLTLKKIPLLRPNTIPATSPYNRDNPLSNIETPLPSIKRKRTVDEEAALSVGHPHTGGKPTAQWETHSKLLALQNTEKDELPKPKRLRPNSLRKALEEATIEENPTPEAQGLNQSEDQDEAAPSERDGSPMRLSGEASPTETGMSYRSPDQPDFNPETTTPQKRTIPFRPTSSQVREFTESAPLRVFAQWDGLFYPAVVNELPTINESTPTRFVGGEISVRLNRMKKLQLSAGDTVKVHGQRQKVWIVQNVYKSTSESANHSKTESQFEREEVVDVNGNDMVKLKHKTSTEILDTYIGNVVLSAKQFSQLKPRTIDVEHALNSLENTPLFKKEESILETPSKLSRRNTPSVVSNTGQKLKLPISSKGKQGIFAGMRFTISFPVDKDDQNKISLTSILKRYGAYILENGFEELFETFDSDNTELIARQGVDDIRFTAVISDRASTTSKYLQALALGIPCLAVKWVEDSVANGLALPWQDYLLPAGESLYLNNVIKSRVIDWIDINAATFSTMFSRRKRLMDGVNDLLKAKSPKARWHFVFSREDRSSFNMKRKGRDPTPSTKIVGDEWLKQSLIFGKLLDEEFL